MVWACQGALKDMSTCLGQQYAPVPISQMAVELYSYTVQVIKDIKVAGTESFSFHCRCCQPSSEMAAMAAAFTNK